MCNTSNSPSLKERVQCYISRRDEIVKDYKDRLGVLNEEACADILDNCPIKVGDVYAVDIDTGWGPRRQYYKVARLDANIDGTVNVYGYKRKLDKTWGKRVNNFMFVVSVYNNYDTDKYDKVENYVEPLKD